MVKAETMDIDKSILPLINAMNNTGWIETVAGILSECIKGLPLSQPANN